MKINEKELISMMELAAEEYGHIHDIRCCVNNEDDLVGGCDCELKDYIEEVCKAIIKKL